MTRLLTVFLLLNAGFGTSTMAGVKSKAAREAAEYLVERFGPKVTEETVETLSEKIGTYSARYGDEAIEAIRKAGPRGFKLIDDAGENAPEVVRLLNRYGNEAVWVASKPKNLAIFVKHGDEAAEAMIKHPGVAVPVIEKFGQPAAHALRSVSPQNARRIAMMADDASLNAAGRADELLAIVGKYGDKAAEFIWRHKAVLAVTAVAAAFIADPQPFIDGTRDLAEVAIRPFDSAAKDVGKGVVEGTNWTIVIISIAALIVSLIWLRIWQPWKRGHHPHRPGPEQLASETDAIQPSEGSGKTIRPG